jgi:hypothetical protein
MSSNRLRGGSALGDVGVMVIYKNVTKGEGGVILTINYNLLIYNAVQCLFEIKNILLYLLSFKIIYLSLFKFI